MVLASACKDQPMALISADALAGYLLEEAIALLLSSNGYRLLQHADADNKPYARPDTIC